MSNVLVVVLGISAVFVFMLLVFQVMDWLDRRRVRRQTKETIDRFNAFVEEQREIWRSISH